MNSIARLKRCVENSPALLEVKYALLKPMHWLHYQIKRDPNERNNVAHGAASVMASPEYPFIPKHPDAGTCRGGHLVMHNGVRVLPTCYIGWQNYCLLRGSKGVHEPEEERIFMDVLATMRPGATMLELGAYWAFYSLWFQQTVPHARSVLVEPVLSHLNYGKKNFRINGRTGTFIHALIGDAEGRLGDECVVSVDGVLRDTGIDALDILHADIQGHERRMLDGARDAIRAGRIRWAFISTHSDALHDDCRRFLLDHGFELVTEARACDIAGPDGVLVVRHASVPDPGIHPIRLRRDVFL